MPIYCRRCTACAHRFEVAVPMREASNITCPTCGGAVDLDMEAQGVPGKPCLNFHGDAQISTEIRCQPREVAQARKDFGNRGAAHCWQDDGKVKFTHKDDANKFFGRLKEIRNRVEERKQADPTRYQKPKRGKVLMG